ncbi:LysE/ArgO family amino acid transporter [Humidisolicoccus flavus]|uniref:LysE/ArgO family amino acid transporter n=1 Tax=Humidisolicoccus flavus TaxID=3111414 RepID=UPI0032453C31
MSPQLLAAVSGLGLGFGLIVAIGAQNLLVLRHGIRREHVLTVVLVCCLSDAILMSAGAAGLGALVADMPALASAARWLGAAFLVVYGSLAIRRALRGGESLQTPGAANAVEADRLGGGGTKTLRRSPTARGSRRAALLSVLAITWLNPHVYLDTIVLLGSIAASHGDHRWWFIAGSIAASFVWFFGLGYGARWLGRFLATETAWRVLDTIIGIVMFGIALSLLVPAQ